MFVLDSESCLCSLVSLFLVVSTSAINSLERVVSKIMSSGILISADLLTHT